ncbi:MAG: hypothetical protein SOR61_04085 [Evtepia sp.]|uniref:hypothetical protein n=1 Tax=Evtepia sp. TaxID=2773933 RepID=UPI002A7505FC|nr:hypothetical protein [Evtepia sp.]MDY3014363.1 hypothetical protein [Evtepia sp.]
MNVIWANYPLNDAVHPQDTSLNFLAQYALQYAGLQGDRYFRFLNQLRQTLPVVTFVGYMDQEGDAYSHMEISPFTSLIKDYQCVQYERLFGLDDEK